MSLIKMIKMTEITERITITLTGQDIIELLKKSGELQGANVVNVSYTVPLGGDYSGMNIDVDKDNTINVNYKIVTTK